MPNRTMHLSEPTIELLAEGALPPEEQAVAVAHIEACPRCAAEAEGVRALFAALDGLPRFATPAGFNDAVMARVVVAPQTSPVLAWLARWLPSTRRGWSVLIAALLVPVGAVVAGVVWALTRLTVPPALLAEWGISQMRDTALTGVSWVVSRVVESGILTRGQDILDALLAVPATALSTVILLIALAIPLSAWSLVHLLRTPMGDAAHA